MRVLLHVFAILIVFGSGIVQAEKATPIEVTADQELEWNRAEQTFIARGNAQIIKGTDSITAPQIIAYYTETEAATQIQKIIAAPDAILTQPGQRLMAKSVTANFEDGVLSTITADKDVVLKTEGETLYGDKGIYDAINRTIVVTGDVRIEQAQNILTGTRAEFDLNTNISRMTAGSSVDNDGRVKAIFFGVEE